MKPETRARLHLVLTAAIALGVGLAAGRFLAPEKVTERIEFRDLAVEDITRGYTFAKVVERTVWRNVTTTTTDAGTTIVDNTIEHEGGNESGSGTEQSHRVEIVERVVERTITVRPDWRIGVLAGASLREPWLPLAGPLVLGVQVDRRIVGGLSAGVWINTVGAAGAAVSLDF